MGQGKGVARQKTNPIHGAQLQAETRAAGSRKQGESLNMLFEQSGPAIFFLTALLLPEVRAFLEDAFKDVHGVLSSKAECDQVVQGLQGFRVVGKGFRERDISRFPRLKLRANQMSRVHEQAGGNSFPQTEMRLSADLVR